MLFSDLMIWGWIRRWRAERRLAAVMESLGSATAADWDAVTACIRTLSTDEDDGGVDWMAQSRVQLLARLAHALEAGDPYTRGHSLRVARYASMITKRMGLDSTETERIRLAGALHDIGKVNTPVAILHKPGRLNDEEFSVVQRHPVDGARLVEALNDPLLTAIVRHHHERLDGGGYPDRLAGDRIPLGAPIMAVADTFDAITSARPTAARPSTAARSPSWRARRDGSWTRRRWRHFATATPTVAR
ncbi:MAG: HD-GYP domain-containing protein [Solirubrobacteraceae bacterium]